MSNNKNVMDSFLDAQKTAIDNMVENTKKFANGNTVAKETIEKGSEWYNNLLDTQKKFFGKSAEKTAEMKENIQENASKTSEFYQNWFQQQMDWAKRMQETNMNFFSNLPNQMNTSNPMNQMNANYQNMWNGMNNWMNHSKPFTGQFGNMANFMPDYNNMGNLFNQYYDMLKNNMTEWQKSFQDGNMQNTWKNMLGANEHYARFYELWAPMLKSIQDKTFTTDLYKQWMNPSAYKTMIDQHFGFLPEQNREYMQQMMGYMFEGYKQMTSNTNAALSQMKGFTQNMPGANPSEMFGNTLNGYNNWYNMLTQGVAPISKMIAGNKYADNANEWADIMNRMMVYHIKNAELQYMTYAQGTKAMDAVAASIMQKMENGEEISSMMDLYKEWMAISDKQFVALFESDEYSQLMAEVSAMQLRLKKDMDLQTEKMLANVPVATRSEMEEMYKTIYEMKKQMRQLEKMLEVAPLADETPVAAPAATATKATATKTAKKA